MCIRKRIRLLVELLVVLVVISGLAVGQEVRKTDSPTREQQTQITAAQSADELLKLSQEFFNTRQLAAATAGIEKACKLQPSLLTDSKQLAPKNWNDYFFQQRAAIQERSLKRTDTAGRLKIAKWLHEGGATSAAGDMVGRILESEKQNKEAQELARQWNLLGAGPVVFDFTLTLYEPLLQPALKDENQDIPLRKDRTLLLLPFIYNPGTSRLILNKGLLKVTTDERKPCMVKGILLLEGGASPAHGEEGGLAPQTSAELKLPASNDPLWDRVQVVRRSALSEGSSLYELTCYHTPHPPVGGSRGRGPVTPQYAADGNRQPTRPGDGYAAFVVDIPQTFKYLNCEYRGCPPLQIEAGFVAAMSVPIKEATPQRREEVVTGLLAYTSAKDRAVAGGAVRKLASLKNSLPEIAGRDSTKGNSLQQKIDESLLATLSNPDPLARQSAFDALVTSVRQPNETSFGFVQACPNADIVLALLEQAQVALVPASAETPSDTQIPPDGQSANAADRFAEKLPTSRAPAAVFSVLAACLGNKSEKVRERTLDILLADGSRQSLVVLSKNLQDTRGALIARLAKVSNSDLKGALLRMLITGADAASVARLLTACRDLPLVITQDDDPLLTALSGNLPPEAQQLLLDMLTRGDLSAVAGSDGFSNILASVAAGQSPPPVRAALLKLALGQFKPPYRAPVKREQGHSFTPSGFENLLAALAAEGDAQTAQTAAETLLASGRIAALKERLRQVPPERQKSLVEQLVKNKKYYENEALPVLLASQVGDPQTAKVAVLALSVLQKNVDPKQRWRMNLAMKQGLDPRQLMDVASGGEEGAAQSAVDLLMKLVIAPSNVDSEFRSVTERSAREQRLAALDVERSTKPAGRFASILYLDLKQAETSLAANEDVRPTLPDRINIPLVGPIVTLQPEPSHVKVLADGRSLDLRPEGRELPPGSTRTILINATALVRMLLNSPADTEKLAPKVNMLELNEPRRCELHYDQMGTWDGEFDMPENRAAPTTSSERHYRVIGGKVVFEPLPPN